MADNLKQRALHGAWWSAIEMGGTRFVHFVIGVILARLLMPEQFGLIGMLGVFMVLSRVFLDSGFGAAIVQRRELTSVDTSSVFYLNVVMGFVLAGMLFLLAPLIADFYDQPELKPLTQFMSLVIAIAGFGVVQSSILLRDLRFKSLTHITLGSGVVTGIAAVVLAYSGFGVWALAWQAVLGAIISTTAKWIVVGWRPTPAFSWQSVWEMFSYGWKLLVSSLMFRGFQQTYRLVIGKVFSAADLGFYTRAVGLEETASLTVNQVISRVTFPVFASIQNNPDRLRRGMRRILGILTLVNTPVMVGLLVVARPLIIVLVTEKWLPTVPLFQALCLVGVLFPLQVINVQYLKATGRSDLMLKTQIAKNMIGLLILAVTCYWGLLAIVWGQVVYSVIAYFINTYYTARLLGYSMRDQLADVLPYFGVTAVMAAAVFPMAYIPGLSPWLLLPLQSASGALLFLLLCWLLHLAAFEEVVVEAKSRLGRYRRKPKP